MYLYLAEQNTTTKKVRAGAFFRKSWKRGGYKERQSIANPPWKSYHV